jgi:CTP synthase (UTP-ammonia lyase)
MKQTIQVGIIGDHDPRRLSHVATEEALGHAARALALSLEIEWLPTPSLDGPDVEAWLSSYDSLWCSPGSPYRSTAGAHAGIRYARERDVPFIGT